MGRILFFVLLGVAAWLALRVWQRSAARKEVGGERRQALEAEPMESCAQCGLNVPRSEAIADGERWYCSEEHRRLGRDAG
jgi:uncharacterized protein